MIRGAIFDADGTLLDSMHIWNELGERYLRSIGKTPEKELSKILFPMSLEESCKYLKKRYSISESEETIKKSILSIISDFYTKEVMPKKGVSEILKALESKKIPMAIATATDKALLKAALVRLGIEKYFTTLLTCSELSTTKHEDTVYRKAADILGTKPMETAVFEDVLFALQTAKRAGFITVAVEDEASASEREAIKALADFYITDFTQCTF